MEVQRKDRDTPKSRRTRARILDEAVKVIASSGYAAATNAAVAEAAGITRGAMLYHFPTREDLLEGVIGYLQLERAELFRRAAEDLPPGADVTEHAIDSYWDLLRHPAFTAFMELETAARTDPVVATLIAPARAEFDRAQIGDHFLKMLHAGAGPRFQASRDLARFMLEGLARADLSYDEDARIERLLTVIKRATHMLNRKGGVTELWPE
ncbi:TetR/AcrR family transcriptional regulator [Caulobacter sp. NIBR1757]|uniref:TetR/AcrR family transcriptional regulator n=1 Tax=Caulobacter sp. NIBR1757 TaxID=3016000 RepID=UPI0022F02BEB|nr:TetR/AcrR family transcriptional regulator [Caulobacter sp. NIBR1757]WGM37482.1 HTH-type transcriptional regulator CymR [Caulobacter sp. NIBR1757]